MIDRLIQDTIGIVVSYLSIHEALFVLPFVNRALFQTITCCHSLLDSHEEKNNLLSDCTFLAPHFEQQLTMRITHEPFRSKLLSKMKLARLSYWEMVDLYDNLVTSFNYQSLVDQIDDAEFERRDLTSIFRSHTPFLLNWLVQTDEDASIRLMSNKSQVIMIELTNRKLSTNMTRDVYRIRGTLISIVKRDNTLYFKIYVFSMRRSEPQIRHIDYLIDEQTDLYAMNICKSCSLDEIQSTTHRVIKFTAPMFSNVMACLDGIILQIPSKTCPSEWRLIEVELDPGQKHRLGGELWGDLEIVGVIQFVSLRNCKATIAPLSITRLSQPKKRLSRLIHTAFSFGTTYRKVLYVHPSYSKITAAIITMEIG